MVYFNCDGCGETLKKSNVDAHAYKCRLCESVSCVDCNVSYFGDDYRKHTSCVTEAERYEKSLYKGQKSNTKKKIKLSPQQVWIKLIQESAEQAPYKVQPILRKIIDLGDNCPRKEKQFRNFVSNSLSLRNKEDVITEVWDYLQKCRTNEQRQPKNMESAQTNEGNTATTLLGINVEEQPIAEEGQLNSIEQIEENTREGMDAAIQDHEIIDSSKAIKVIKKVLKKSPGQKMKLKELRKQVKIQLALEKYSKDQLKTLVEKHLKAKTLRRVKIEGKTVHLLSK